MKTTLVCAFSLVFFTAFAQNNPPGAPPPPPPQPVIMVNNTDAWGARSFHFGLNITPGVYFLSPNSSNNTTNGASFGFGYGANLEFYFTRNYGFVTGFELATIGAKYTNTTVNPTSYITDSTITHNESIQYLEIPLLLKMKTNPIHGFRYYGVVGLQVGFALKATDDYTSVTDYTFYNIPVTHSASNANISDQTDLFRLSLVVGLGAEYNIAGNTALQACLTYNNCFTNMNNSSSNAINIKGVELMIGVLF